MSDLKLLKRLIYKDGRVEEVLELLGCEHIKTVGQWVQAQLPNKKRFDDHDNKRSVQVKLIETLPSYIRSKGVNGDLFTLVSFIEHDLNNEEEWNDDLHDAKMWLINNLGYHHILDEDYTPPVDPNAWLKSIKKKRTKKINLDEIKQNEVLPKNIVELEGYDMTPHKLWKDEGIKIKTQRLFEVGYDPVSNRIITLIRNKDGGLIGVKGRTLEPEYEAKQIPKYLYLYEINKHIEFYNLHRALPYILERKRVFVWEGYKSCMKCHQWNFPESISIEGDSLSDVQAQILMNLPKDVEIIFCYDKDKYFKRKKNEETGEFELIFTPDFILKQRRMLPKRTVYAVCDTPKLKLLDFKDSPIDKGKEVFEKLLLKKMLVPLD